MTLFSTLRFTSSIPFTWRAPLLAAVFFACLLLNADYARGQAPPDDHANIPIFGTPVALNSSVSGRIDPSTDIDFFILDLRAQTATTDVLIYADGDFDSVGVLLASDGEQIAYNNDGRVDGRRTSFQIRADLDPGIYFLLVRSAFRAFVGDYTVYVQSVTKPGSSIETATPLALDAPTQGRIDLRGEANYFRMDLQEELNVWVRAENPILLDSDAELLPVAPLDPVVLDADAEEVSVNVDVYSRSLRFGFYIEDDFTPGTYYLKITTPTDNFDTEYPVVYTIQAIEDEAYNEFLETCDELDQALDDPTIDDPFFACQWHLEQPSGEDVNVRPVWDEGFMGEGVNVAVVDTGMDWSHEDLIDNVDSSLNHDFNGEGDIHHPYSHHGTNVAGVIAARDNDIGVRGVAPRATIYGYNMLDAEVESESAEDVVVAQAAGINSGVTAISNNSWGYVDAPVLPPSIWELAVETAVKQGYGGKGVFYVWSAGNDDDIGDHANLEGIANFHAITAVCAVSVYGVKTFYSETGPNLWVCAPGGFPIGEDDDGIVTVENSDRYTDFFNGTSAAAPIVSGVAALVREANPELTWRDVKLVLAESARKNDPDNQGWEYGATTYGSGTDRYHFSHEYGFGVVDAAAAVDLAKTWTNLPPMREASIESAKIDRLIPDAYDAASIETVTLTLDIDSDIDFIEFAEIDTSFQHNSFRDLHIELESPSGEISILSPAFDTFTDDDDPDNDYISMRDPFRFGSARHLGEDPNGTWTLRVTDRFKLGTGILESWGLTIYGHTSVYSSLGKLGDRYDANRNGRIDDAEVLNAVRDYFLGLLTTSEILEIISLYFTG